MIITWLIPVFNGNGNYKTNPYKLDVDYEKSYSTWDEFNKAFNTSFDYNTTWNEFKKWCIINEIECEQFDFDVG